MATRNYNPEYLRQMFDAESTATPIVIDQAETVRIVPVVTRDEESKRNFNDKIEVKEKINTETEADVCSICMEPWNSEGDHQVSCLPCGHLYGFSCIRKWLQLRTRSQKCPQCNAKCTAKNITKLYASPAVNDNGPQKKVQALESEVSSLKKQSVALQDRQNDLIQFQENLLKELKQNVALLERQNDLIQFQENLLKELQILNNKQACAEKVQFNTSGHCRFTNPIEGFNGQFENAVSSTFNRQTLHHCNITLQHELPVDSARIFALDINYQNLIILRRISGMGGLCMLNKINLINPHENEDIQIPTSIRAIKDLQISLCGRLALLASLGKKLAVLSMASNSIVTTYNLREPAWSCSWDRSSSHYMYAGLQDGTVSVFDIRFAMNPLKTMVGLSPQSIHTMHSLTHNPALGHNARLLLTASSLGPCAWNLDSGQSPLMVPGLDGRGNCTSLAYGPSSDDIIASYRPVGVVGSQVLVKRGADAFYYKLGSTPADAVVEKSTIIDMDNCYPLFAYADASTYGLRLRALPNSTASSDPSQMLKSHHRPILDVKYAHAQGTGILGCISEDNLQLFSVKAP